jgi:Cu+-exporting ATPase
MEDETQERIRYYVFAAAVGVLLALNWLGIFKTFFGIDTAIFITLLAGYKTFYNSISALLERRISADIALCVAVVAAIAVGQYMAAAEAMFIVLVGEGLESFAAGRTAAAIEKFVEQLPRTARLFRDGREEDIKAELLLPGDLIVVRAGERIPADGVVDQGLSFVNEASITGEPLAREKGPADEVFSGSLNGNGLLRIRVTRSGANTTLARVIELVKEAQLQRAPVERLADRVAVYFLPALLLAAALTFFFTRDWSRTVSVLIVACPCALILATPTAMVAAIGGLARRGILVRGGSVLQRAAGVDTAVFDKTGTITEGQFEIVRLLPVARTEADLLTLAAAAEGASHHPLAKLIHAEAMRRGLTVPKAESAEVLPGKGARCIVAGRPVLVGNAILLAEAGIAETQALIQEADALGATAVLVAVGDELAGAILLRDRVRDGARAAVQSLRDMGFKNLLMLTGDRRRAAELVAREVGIGDAGIGDVEAELLPEQKLERVRALTAAGNRTAMIGDGVNDAPALASASVGIAVAGASDVTAEAADVVFLPHSLESLPELFKTSRRAVRTAWQNIILFAGILNATAVLLAATGKIGPVGAAVTHQLSSFFVMMNSLRLLYVRPAGGAGWRSQISEWLDRSPLPRFASGFRESAEHFEFDAIAGWVFSHWNQIRKPLIYTCLALFLLNGFYALKPDEAGIIERFGKKTVPNGEPGLHYKLPWPIDRLTRVQAHRVRVAEVGFRTNLSSSVAEPAAYEWNVQHRTGRIQKVSEESLMLTGDQNMIELNATVQYSPDHPDDFLFRQIDGDATVRAAAESVIQSIVTQTLLDDLLTTGRKMVEERARALLQQRLDRYTAGVEVLQVRLEDVHPSLEVVDAFREVSGAFEEKSRLINEAEAYRNEQLALARGNAQAQLRNAASYRLGRTNRASGDASRFTLAEDAYRAAPQATEHRLYLESIEAVLPGKKKIIVDKTHGRRHLLLLEDGVEIPSLGALN